MSYSLCRSVSIGWKDSTSWPRRSTANCSTTLNRLLQSRLFYGAGAVNSYSGSGSGTLIVFFFLNQINVIFLILEIYSLFVTFILQYPPHTGCKKGFFSLVAPYRRVHRNVHIPQAPGYSLAALYGSNGASRTFLWAHTLFCTFLSLNYKFCGPTMVQSFASMWTTVSRRRVNKVFFYCSCFQMISFKMKYIPITCVPMRAAMT